MTHYTAWPEDRLTELRALVAIGLSGQQIANILNTTKGAISGACQRNGITLCGLRRGHPTIKLPPSPKAKVVLFDGEGLRLADVTPLNIPFADLSDGQCKYPVTESSPHLFCGHPADGSYCPAHRELTRAA